MTRNSRILGFIDPLGRAATGLFLALALLTGTLSRVAAQMAEDSWSTDPTMNALNPGQASRFRSGPDFPLTAYNAIGSSFARTGYFAELGWNDAQVAGLLEGINATFQGRPIPLDDPARQLLFDLSQRISGKTPAAGVGSGSEFPVSSCSAVGSFLALTGHFAELGWNDAQIKAFIDGLRAAFQGRPVEIDAKSRQLLVDTGRQIADIEALRKLDAPKSTQFSDKLEFYMRKVRVRLGLQQSESGMAYRVEKGRGGPRPRPGDTIVITCSATDANGTTKLPQMSGERIRMKMDNLLPGLMEGIQMMTIDSSAVFVIPPKLSFGDNPWPEGVAKGAPIIVTVTLLDVVPEMTVSVPATGP